MGKERKVRQEKKTRNVRDGKDWCKRADDGNEKMKPTKRQE